jgi:IS605 OrfB family transposase
MKQKGYQPSHPTLTFKNRKLLIHIPFQKTEVQSNPTQSQKKSGIELQVDQGLIHFAVITLRDMSKGKYGTFVPKKQYFLGQEELFDKKFDPKSGKIILQDKFRGKNGELREENCKKTNIKRKLINIRREIRKLQKSKNEYEQRCLELEEDYKRKYKWNRIRRELSKCWNKLNNINSQIVQYTTHYIIAIANHSNAWKINVEDLGWSAYKKKKDAGSYLAFWRVQWFFSQLQSAVGTQCKIHGIEFERVRADYSSQECSKCAEMGIVHKGKRKGKTFICNNHSKPFIIDSDLNASRLLAFRSSTCPIDIYESQSAVS